MAITEVAGVRVGHWSDAAARTGCTVLLAPPEGAVASVDVRGSAPGSRETDLLRPGMLVERVHALALCGATVGALAVVNALGDVMDERGQPLAGSGAWRALLGQDPPSPPSPGANST